MMKTILVPTSGSSTDESVFATALVAARALNAHLEFYHVRLSAVQAALRAPHVDFCAGAAIPVALEVLSEDAQRLSKDAREHFKAFCNRHRVDIRAEPEHTASMSASFLEEQDNARDRLMLHGRHSDLVVLGRPSHIDYLPPQLLQDMLIECGRPILVAPDYSPKTLLDTVVVGWKETANCARALSAAYPFLEQAKKVVLLNLAEGNSGIPASLEHLGRRLKWHGMSVETHSIGGVRHNLTYEVARAAGDLHADLLVVGAFGHRRLRETLFGGVTQWLLENGPLPILTMH